MWVRDDYHKELEVLQLITDTADLKVRGFYRFIFNKQMGLFHECYSARLGFGTRVVFHCKPVLECTSAFPHKGGPSDNQRVTEML